MSNVAQTIECRCKKEHTKEESLSLTAVDEVLIRDAENLHDTRELLLLIFTWEDGKTSVELGQDATQTPHVDSHTIVHAKNDLGRTVETTLNICVHLQAVNHRSVNTISHTFFVLKARTTKVNNLDLRRLESMKRY